MTEIMERDGTKWTHIHKHTTSTILFKDTCFYSIIQIGQQLYEKRWKAQRTHTLLHTLDVLLCCCCLCSSMKRTAFVKLNKLHIDIGVDIAPKLQTRFLLWTNRKAKKWCEKNGRKSFSRMRNKQNRRGAKKIPNEKCVLRSFFPFGWWSIVLDYLLELVELLKLLPSRFSDAEFGSEFHHFHCYRLNDEKVSSLEQFSITLSLLLYLLFFFFACANS